jgi:tRNA(adenine34) deaminase
MADNAFMALALEQAAAAMRAGEVPVGAVLVRAGQVIAVGSNAPIGRHDPSAHAEIVAIRAAARFLGNYRLMDCELFVTLEPCVMCAGAMLQARLKRVVYGASDPKTGAAGSVLNLFANPRLNHQTQVQAGVLAEECGSLLRAFFKHRRDDQRLSISALREDALRTPEKSFSDLSDFPWQANYVNNLPALAGLRLHYLDEGPRDAALTYLCLHDHKTWGYLFRNQIPVLLAGRNRVVVPDLIGFGKSDKPKKESFHRLDWHLQVLLDFVDQLDLRNMILMVQELNHVLARMVQRARPDRFLDLKVVNLAPDREVETHANQVPFPDQGHRAAQRSFQTILAQPGQNYL